MVDFLFALAANCAIAVFLSACVSVCESHKVYFSVHPDFAGREELLRCHKTSEAYRTAVDGYISTCQEWPEFKGARIGMVIVFIGAIGCFVGVASYFRANGWLMWVTVILPITLALLLIRFSLASLKRHRRCQKSGDWHKDFSRIIYPILQESARYTYIENTAETERLMGDVDLAVSLMATRANQAKNLRFLEHDYSTHWLTFAALFMLAMWFAAFAK